MRPVESQNLVLQTAVQTNVCSGKLLVMTGGGLRRLPLSLASPGRGYDSLGLSSLEQDKLSRGPGLPQALRVLYMLRYFTGGVELDYGRQQAQ
jgi:hypothetical protein